MLASQAANDLLNHYKFSQSPLCPVVGWLNLIDIAENIIIYPKCYVFEYIDNSDD